MDWKDKIQAARDSGQKVFDHQSDAVINEHWPKAQALFKEKVGPAALAAANDDHKMELLFKVVYKALPFPVHLVIKEAAFIKFCFAHRNQLLPPAETKTGTTGS
jgi:hypothetical protein